jgi:hypothetical protein
VDNITTKDPTNIYDTLDVGAFIAEKGMSDSILFHIEPDQITDSRLAELWRKARVALEAIDIHIDNEHFRRNRDPR